MKKKSARDAYATVNIRKEPLMLLSGAAVLTLPAIRCRLPISNAL